MSQYPKEIENMIIDDAYGALHRQKFKDCLDWINYQNFPILEGWVGNPYHDEGTHYGFMLKSRMGGISTDYDWDASVSKRTLLEYTRRRFNMVKGAMRRRCTSFTEEKQKEFNRTKPWSTRIRECFTEETKPSVDFYAQEHTRLLRVFCNWERENVMRVFLQMRDCIQNIQAADHYRALLQEHPAERRSQWHNEGNVISHKNPCVICLMGKQKMLQICCRPDLIAEEQRRVLWLLGVNPSDN